MGLPTLQWRSVERQRNPTTAELPDQRQKDGKTGQYETDKSGPSQVGIGWDFNSPRIELSFDVTPAPIRRSLRSNSGSRRQILQLAGANSQTIQINVSRSHSDERYGE